MTCLGWLSDPYEMNKWPKQRSGMQGSRIELPGLWFVLFNFLGYLLKIYHRTRPGMDLTDWLRGPSNREGQFFNRACAHFVSGGEPLGCAYRFAAFMQQPGWPIFPSKGSQQQWGLRTNQTMKMVWYIFWKLGRHQLPQLQLGFQRYFWSFMFRWLVVGRFAVHPHA